MFGIYKRVSELEKQCDRIEDECSIHIHEIYAEIDALKLTLSKKTKKAAPKKKAKPVADPFKPQLYTHGVKFNKDGQARYAPKKKAHLSADEKFMVSYGEPVKKKPGRPRKTK